LYAFAHVDDFQVKRIDTKTDGNYFDLHERGSLVYEFKGSSISVHTADGRTFHYPTTSLVSRWSFGTGEMLTMKQISSRSCIPLTMRQSIEYRLPQSFCDELFNSNINQRFDNFDGIVHHPILNQLPECSIDLATTIVKKLEKKLDIYM